MHQTVVWLRYSTLKINQLAVQLKGFALCKWSLYEMAVHQKLDSKPRKEISVYEEHLDGILLWKWW
jgi:hypothetical protein